MKVVLKNNEVTSKTQVRPYFAVITDGKYVERIVMITDYFVWLVGSNDGWLDVERFLGKNPIKICPKGFEITFTQE